MSKKVEFLARFPKKKTLSDEDKALRNVQKLINPDEEQVDEIEFEFDYVIIDLKDIADIIRFDENYTQITKYSNMLYILKIPYEEFKELYQEMLGCIIYTTISPEQII